MNTTKLPYSFTPRDYQIPFLRALDNGIKRAVLVWHRRSGKDKTAFAALPKEAFKRKGTYFYLAPTYTQGKKIIWDGIDKNGFRFLHHVPKQLIKGKPNETEMKIDLVNGSVIQVIGTDKIDSIVGTNPLGCVFTEYSLQNPKAWDLIRPILAENGGWAVFIYTPRGMNHGYKILQQAKDNPKWFTQILTVDDTKAIPKEVLEEERRDMPADLYEQEYNCKFIEGASQFFKRIDENTWNGDLQPNPGHLYQVGVDLAKYQDFTVITPFDKTTFQVGKQERFNQMDFNLQKARIEAVVRRFDANLCIDSTGIGDPVVEDLGRTGISIYPEGGFKFSATSRMNLLNNLAILLAQDKIKIPNDEGLIEELKAFQYTTTPTGVRKVSVPAGIHDDRVMSLALAVYNAKVPISSEELNQDFGLYETEYN